MQRLLVSSICLIALSGCGGTDSSVVDDVNDAIDLVEDVTDTIEDVSDLADEISELTSTSYSLNNNDAVGYSSIECEDNLLEVVTLINEIRAEAQICGVTSYPAVEALTWNNLLALAAEQHSDNMANYDFFAHEGLDDSTVGTRVTAQGYSWNSVAENIAAGYSNAQTTVDALMESEGHCKNIMRASVTEIGLACTYNSDSTYKTYWTQVFANAN